MSRKRIKNVPKMLNGDTSWLETHQCLIMAGRCNLGGLVEVWSEKACLPGQAGLESAVPLRFGSEPHVGSDRWYALYVRSRHEKTVEGSLRGKGYSVFSPSY